MKPSKSAHVFQQVNCERSTQDRELNGFDSQPLSLINSATLVIGFETNPLYQLGEIAFRSIP